SSTEKSRFSGRPTSCCMSAHSDKTSRASTKKANSKKAGYLACANLSETCCRDPETIALPWLPIDRSKVSRREHDA
ncbi:hypothetical protein, partial [Shinella zoogloeoides]|uniref:hypothetical protein n=1 Tax=Shinella zoogloeoides TaxID=352475 RepID=UPI0019D19D5E